MKDLVNDGGASGVQIQMSWQDLAMRKSWQELTPEDERLIAEVDKLLQDNIDDLIETMYGHFLAFPQIKKLFPNPEILKRAQIAQAQYFLRLTKGNYDEDYVADRLRVGSTHYRIGLDPHWYLGAYRLILSWFRKQLADYFVGQPEKVFACINALTKVIFFDMSLAIDSYMNAKEEAIKKQRDAILELESERRATKSILENAPISIARLDRNFNCVEFNKEFVQLIDVPDRELIIGKNLFEILPYLPKEPFQNILHGGQPYIKMATPLNLAKSPQLAASYWDLSIWPIKEENGDIAGIVTEFVGATDRVLLQQQREDFVATLTHDLKTPILAANRAVKLLIEGDFGPVLEEQSQVLQTIHESNESLYNLVQTLLEVYRYESGAMQLSLESHDLEKIINKLVIELQLLAKEKNIQMSTQIANTIKEVKCDAGEIRRVVQNLLDNSFKFTERGGTIVISIEQVNGKTTVKVQDTGQGISDEDKSKLFQRFWQATSGGRHHASTGLGLYLCRKIVELHGGRIWCNSELGKGSTFAFVIDT